MAFAITCPECDTKLKTAAAIPVGRSVQCPKCKTSFKVSDSNMEEVSEGKPPAASASSKPAASASTKPAPARNTRDDDDDDRPRSRKRDDDDDDDRPRSRKRDDDDDDNRERRRGRDDDKDKSVSARLSRLKGRNEPEDDDRPRSRKRDDDDDDRPRSRGRDDDDDRPSRRSRDDDDDDRSRSRSRDDDEDDRSSRRSRDDDDDDDRPSRKKKKKKKKKGSLMWLWMTLGGVAVVGGIVVLLIFLLGGGSVDKEMLSYMPSDTTSIVYVDVSSFLKTKLGKEAVDNKLNEPALAEAKEAGMTINDIDKMMMGNSQKGGVTVVRFKKSIDKAKFTSKHEEQKSGDKSYYKPKAGFGSFMFFASDDLVVSASSEELIKSLISKESGKVVISTDLQEIVDSVAKGTTWTAGTKGGGGMFAMGGGKTKGGGMWFDLGDSTVSFGMITIFENEEDAKKAQEESEKRLDEIRKEDGVKSASISRSGTKVTMEVSGSTSALEKKGGGGRGRFPF